MANVLADLSGTVIGGRWGVWTGGYFSASGFVLIFAAVQVFPLKVNFLCLSASFLVFVFPSLSLDDGDELALIPWDEQRHREMDWCEAEECR